LEKWTAGTMSPDFVNMVEDKCYVAIVDNAVVGTGMIDLRSGKIDAVFVMPTFMGKGIGRQMMLFLERLAVEAGISQINLEATLNAASFYKAVGFQGDTVSKYCSSSGLSLDCIPMVKDLPSCHKNKVHF
jgi:GNAT superfamily N-acetyltransferase